MSAPRCGQGCSPSGGPGNCPSCPLLAPGHPHCSFQAPPGPSGRFLCVLLLSFF